MSSQPPIKDCQCDVCFKFFPKGSALIRHSLDLGHGSHRYCKPCKRQFTTVGAFKDHQQLAKAHQQQQPSGSSIPSAVSTGPSNAQSGPVRDAIGTKAPSPLSHKGIRYTSLPKSDHARILKLLGNQVHPVRILKNHGYKFDTNATGPPNVCHACGTAAIFGDHGDRFSPLPKARAGSGARKAVSIDCEMARLENGTNGVISMAVVDFLTGEKIITSLVQPHEPVDNWKTKLHGISPALIASERAKNAVLDGWQAARAELFKHVDEDTILIGQSLNHDLKPLRIQHDKIVDSAVMASEAVHGRGSKPNYWGLGLRILCEELPKIKIRQGLLGKNGEEESRSDTSRRADRSRATCNSMESLDTHSCGANYRMSKRWYLLLTGCALLPDSSAAGYQVASNNTRPPSVSCSNHQTLEVAEITAL